MFSGLFFQAVLLGVISYKKARRENLFAIIVRWCNVSINVKLEASKGVALLGVLLTIVGLEPF